MTLHTTSKARVQNRFTLLIIMTLIAISGCSSMPTDIGTAGTPSQPPSTVPESAALTEHGIQELEPDLIYQMLCGEIAVQRDQKQEAYEHYLEAARLSGDALLAERATQLALATNNPSAIRKATDLWIRVAPNRSTPYQILSLLDIQANALDAALNNLITLIELGNRENGSGFYQAANVLDKTNNPTMALELMQKLTSDTVDNPEAQFALALTANRARRHDLATNAINKALRLRPDWPQAIILLSRTELTRGKQAEAQQTLKEATDNNPGNIMLRTAYARLLLEIQQFSAAYTQFKTLLEDQPDNPDTLYSLGILSTQLEKPEEAKTHFKHLIELNKRPNDAKYHLGQIEELAGNDNLAIDWYSQVNGERRLEAYARIAVLHARNGNIDKARSILGSMRIGSEQHASRLYSIEASLLADAGQPKEALKLYDEALTAFPEDTQLRYARAMLNATQGHLDLLEQDLKLIINKNPDHADALNALGYTLADQTDRYQEAFEYIQRALKLKPDNPAIMDSMGWVQFRLGNYDEALRYLRRAMQLQPDPEIAAHLGEVLWTIGNTEQARKVWNEAYTKEPNSDYLNKVIRRYPQ